MKVSVIVAAYNAQQYLLEAMDSALNQTIDDYEVIVINDGSTDSTLQILSDLARDYEKLKIINKENGGPSSARNAGLQIAQGEYVYFMDSDDILEFDALEKMYERAESTEADLVIANYNIFSSNSVTRVNNLKNLLHSSNIQRFNRTILWTFSLWNKLFRRSIIEENQLEFPPISYSEDGVFTMKFTYRCKKIVGLNRVIYHYRRMYDGSGSSITASVNASKIRQYLQAHAWIYEEAKNALLGMTEEEKEIIDAGIYLSEIYRKEVQILLNQFYREIWTLDRETADLIVDSIKELLPKMEITALSRILAENNDTPLYHITADKKEIVKQAIFTAALYGEKEQKDEFLLSLKSLALQSLVQTKIVLPAFMKKDIERKGAYRENMFYIECSSRQEFYNKALEEATTELILFTEAKYEYPAYTLKRVFKYMKKSPAEMIAQTVYYNNYGQSMPVYPNSIAFTAVKNGLKNCFELCLDYTLSNKFFRVDFLRNQHLVFGKDPRTVLPHFYETAYWSFLNDQLVFFNGHEDEFLKTIESEESLKYVEEYCQERPVDLSKKDMGYDSSIKFTKLTRYPKSPRGEKTKQRLISLFRKRPIKNRTAFISVRADNKLEGNALALYPYIEGKKVVCSRRLPHSYFFELKTVYYMLTSKVIITDDYVRYARWVRLRPGQRLIQLWHACGAFKMFGQRGTTMSIKEDRATHAQYSLVSVSGPYIRSIYADAFDIPLRMVSALGTPRTDMFFDEEYKEGIRETVYKKLPYLKDKEIILYAPTFRDMGGRREIFEPDLDFDRLSAELKPNQVFIICPHPIMTNDIIQKKYPNIFVTREVSTNDLMFVSDMLITDYSSVVFEYALLRKPIAFYCYDLRLYDRGFFLKYPDDLPGDIYETQRELMKFIHNPKQEKNDRKYEEFLNRYMAACDGHSCERIAAIVNDYLKKEI